MIFNKFLTFLSSITVLATSNIYCKDTYSSMGNYFLEDKIKDKRVLTLQNDNKDELEINFQEAKNRYDIFDKKKNILLNRSKLNTHFIYKHANDNIVDELERKLRLLYEEIGMDNSHNNLQEDLNKFPE